MKISHTRGDVTLTRTGTGNIVQWAIVVEGPTSDATQGIVINSPQVIEDLKALIGQVEHAAKVLGDDSSDRVHIKVRG